MFKLQFLLGLLLGIQINLIKAEQQLMASAKLRNATADTTLLNIILNNRRGKTINTKNTNLPDDTNPEEGNYLEGDLLFPTNSKISITLKHISSLNGQRNDINPKGDSYIAQDLLNSTDTAFRNINSIADQGDKTNNFPDDYSPEEGDEMEGDILMPKFNNFPDEDNPEEGDEIEGDLLIPTGNTLRSSIIKAGSFWPGALVPYEFNATLTKKQLKPLFYAFKQYAKKTCVRFIPRTTERDFVSVAIPEKGCSSNVGRIGGKQILNLAPNCFRHGTIMHELMHILGFLHEQNSSNRDEFVKIMLENLIPGREVNYKKFKEEETSNLNVTYDYGSLMHYRAKAFSKNGKPTMMALKEIPKGVKMGQRRRFSHNDLIRINRRYQCNKSSRYQKSALN